MHSERKHTRRLNVGGVAIGGGAPVTVQSMTNTATKDVEATLSQIARLREHGCQIVRVAVLDRDDAMAVRAIVDKSPIPVVADIHFDVRLAILALEGGAHKLRINPGNIGGEDKVALLADALRQRPVPVRVGINSGSVERHLLSQYGGPTPRAMLKSAVSHAMMLEKRGFYDIAISLKGTSVPDTVAAYRMAAAECDYALHVGFTHMGLPEDGAVKTAIGIGALLLDGIGDTIRVSLAADPVKEAELGVDILKAVGLRTGGVTVIACPTCGRCCMDVVGVARKVRDAVRHINAPITAAVMGCVVNGPGEAKQADLGVAGGKSGWALFQGDEIVKIAPEDAADALIRRIMDIAAKRGG